MMSAGRARKLSIVTFWLQKCIDKFTYIHSVNMSMNIELIVIPNSGNYIDEQDKLLVLRVFYSRREEEQLKTSIG